MQKKGSETLLRLEKVKALPRISLSYLAHIMDTMSHLKLLILNKIGTAHHNWV